MEDRPQLVLRDPRLQRVTDARDGDVADIHGQLHAPQLFWRLDHPGELGRFLRVEQRDVGRFESPGQPGLATVDGEAAIGPSMGDGQGDDLARPALAHLGRSRPGEEVER